MALLVAFSGARMTELANISRQDIVIGEDEMKVKMIIKKRKKPVPFDVPFKRREGDVCPVRALEKWMNQKHCTKKENEGIWWNFQTNRKMGSQGCSKMLRSLLDEIGIDQKFGGSTVRHAMKTKLTSEGATLKEMNEFTRHQENSNCVDNFYNIQVARDLGALLLNDIKVYN
ncbi:MAG: hypothetical protein EZS28_046584 [Streblomastix strix]|uniref:Tyr recombinase domain-containing protein n=1 Tax=Streblomastix strix TaxID=222440 RepID=A0A5J4TJE1_9EUKA|nr:MAG: hypothetical protein EZS28_046584 [Streblomastix strix]